MPKYCKLAFLLISSPAFFSELETKLFLRNSFVSSGFEYLQCDGYWASIHRESVQSTWPVTENSQSPYLRRTRRHAIIAWASCLFTDLTREMRCWKRNQTTSAACHAVGLTAWRGWCDRCTSHNHVIKFFFNSIIVQYWMHLKCECLRHLDIG